MSKLIGRPVSMRDVSRRGVLAGAGGAVLLASGVGTGHAATSASAASDEAYEAALDVWRGMLTGTSVDPGNPAIAAAITRLDDSADGTRARIDRSADRDRVFTDVPFTTEANIRTTYSRLKTMATAYRTPGSALEGDAGILDDVLAGLRTTYDEIYHPGQDPFGNWWQWEIGASRDSMDTCALISDAIDPADLANYLAAIDYFVPDPFYHPWDGGPVVSVGANRVDLCRAVVVRGLLGRDDEKVTRARDGLSDVLVYVTSGDGFYADGSFIQHDTMPYTGAYGGVLLDGMARIISLLAGSPWEVVDPNRGNLFDAVENAFAPVIYNNQMMDCVRGRAISRSGERDRNVGLAVVEHILRLAPGAAVEDPVAAGRWRGICKGWLTRDTQGDPLASGSVPRIAAYADILGDDAVPATPEPARFHLFGSMDRAVHRRPGWAFAIAMSSVRIAYYEAGNGENEQGFHTGAGMTSLYLHDDNGHYTDNFWPTVDLYRLPGTTVDSQPLPDAAGGQWGDAKPPSATWVGGASLDDTFGAVGMHLQGLLSTMEARKSWFCLDDLVIALGAGITGGSSEHPVETIVENRNLRIDGTNTLLLDGEPQPTDRGWAATRPVRWAHLEGVGGYVFPRSGHVNVLREERTGSWRDVNDGGSTTPITRRYLTMWFDHGTAPDDAAYAYILVPNGTPARTRQLAAAGRADLQIIENSAQLQAIRSGRLGLTAANFWAPGAVDGITVSAPCSIVIREFAGSLQIAVADPTQQLETLELTVARPGYRLDSADDTVRVVDGGPPIRLSVDTTNSYGATHRATFVR